jgi:hypothetical protein
MDITVAWAAPASEIPAGSAEEDHYDVAFGLLVNHEPKGSLSSDFLGVTAPGEYPSRVRLYDTNGDVIGDDAVGPVFVIEPEGPVTVHIPEGVTAGVKVTMRP